MTFKDKVDLAVAVGTLLAVVFAAVSALVAAKSARDASRAIRMQREAVRAQTFVSIIGYEREINFSQCMDTIRGLGDADCKDYAKFRKMQPDKEQQIRQVVDFLNHLGHLIRQGYVEPRHILPLYSTSIEACRKKLLGRTDWLAGFRVTAKSPGYYLNFECLCENLEKLWKGKKVDWPDPAFQASEEMRSE
jgi:hypothetical protein